MRGTNLDFQGAFSHRSLRESLTAARQGTLLADADGAIQASFRVTGPAGDPVVESTLTSPNLVLLQQPLGTLEAALRYERSAFSLQSLRLVRQDGGRLEAEGEWNATQATLKGSSTVRGYRIDALQLPDGTPVRMTLDGEARVEKASAREVQAKLSLTASAASVGSIAAKRVEIEGHASGQEIRLQWQAPEWAARGQLTTLMSGRAPAEFTIDAKGAPIGAFTPLYTGEVTARASGSFSFSDPANTLRAVVDLASARVRPATTGSVQNEFRAEGPARLEYDGGSVSATPIVITGPGDSRFVVSGRAPVLSSAPAGALRIQGGADLGPLTQAFPALASGVTLNGRLTAALELAGGGGAAWTPSGEVSITSGELNHVSLPAPVTGIDARLRVTGRHVELERVHAQWIGGRVAATGRIPINLLSNPGAIPASPEQFELQASLDGLALERLSTATGRPIGGLASLRLSLSGTGLDPAQWQGRLEAPELRINLGQAVFEQRTPLVMTLRNSLVAIEPFAISGSASNLHVRGSVSLGQSNPLALRLNGEIDGALLQLFTTGIRADGVLALNAALTGTLERPRLSGQIELKGIQAEFASAGAAVEDVRGVIRFDGQEIQTGDIHGELNGGSFTANGAVKLQGQEIAQVDLKLQGKGTSWNIPAGLETVNDLELRLTGSPSKLAVTGTVTIQNGSYREALVLERGLLSALSPSASLTDNLTPGIGPAPAALDIRVTTAEPVTVANDLLNGDLSANLRLLGTTARPGLVGRLDAGEGAVLYLGGRNYIIDRGAVTFTDQRKIEPVLDVSARTRAGGIDITLQARGTVGQRLETTFTSDPPLGQTDILSLLVSGRRIKDTRGAETEIAQDQALSYLSGNLAGALSQRANRALGLNVVRIDPGLIADEAEPTARLTLGQDITDRLGLVYSVNLRNSSDQIWVGRADITRRLQARTVRQSDNSFRFQVQHGIELGGVPAPRSGRRKLAALKVGEIRFDVQGATPLQTAKFRSKLGIKPGKPFDFLAYRKGMEKVRKILVEQGYPEARLRTSREESGGVLNLSIGGSTGPKVEFRFEGSGISRAARKAAVKAWSSSSFDSLRIRQAADAVRQRSSRDGRFAAEAEARVEQTALVKRVTFTIAKGRKYDGVEIDLPGAARPAAVLAAVAPTRAAARDAAASPGLLRDRVEAYYRRQGYLDVRAGAPELVKAAKLTIKVPVVEGQRMRLGRVTVPGNRELTAEEFRRVAGLTEGAPYAPAELEEARRRMETALAARDLTGFAVKLTPQRRGASVDVAFEITVGRRRALAAVTIEGNQHVSDALVRSQIGIRPGESVTDAKLNQARQNLYSTGAFALADLDVRENGQGSAAAGSPVQLVARLREVRPIEIRYGLLFDTERGAGGIVDFATRNLLGAARTAGLRARYDARLRDARVYAEQPSLLRLPLKLVTTGFVRRELSDLFLTDRAGGSAYLEYRWNKSYPL